MDTGMPAFANCPPKRILVIDFGQLGDVVLSLPALRAIRERFARSSISVLCGLPPSEIVRMCDIADEVITLDRVRLKYGNKLKSAFTIAKLLGQIRSRRFDLVIDLHSLSETNLLAWASGAPYRAGALRKGRSLVFLINLKPPREDLSKHHLDRFLDVLIPLGITNASRKILLPLRPDATQSVEELLAKDGLRSGQLLIGINPGGAFEGRRWRKENFAAVGEKLARAFDAKIAVFAGPEERPLAREIVQHLPDNSGIAFDHLTIPQLVSAIARCAVLITNDTGPMHLASAVGTPTVALMNRPTPSLFDPIGDINKILRAPAIADIGVEEVFTAVSEVLGQSRTAMLGDRP